MIVVSEDNSEIYSLLERCEKLFTDFSIDHILLFDHEDDCILVIYEALNRSFKAFKARDYQQDVNALPELLAVVNDLVGSEALIGESIRLVESKMHSSDNHRFYFDAH